MLILARQPDKNGDLCNISVNYRVIDLKLDSLKKIPAVIAVEEGGMKEPAIFAMLKGVYIDVIVPDFDTVNVHWVKIKEAVF